MPTERKRTAHTTAKGAKERAGLAADPGGVADPAQETSLSRSAPHPEILCAPTRTKTEEGKVLLKKKTESTLGCFTLAAKFREEGDRTRVDVMSALSLPIRLVGARVISELTKVFFSQNRTQGNKPSSSQRLRHDYLPSSVIQWARHFSTYPSPKEGHFGHQRRSFRRKGDEPIVLTEERR